MRADERTKACGRVMALCAIAIPVWWAGLFASPNFRAVFFPSESWATVRTFFVPDLLLAVATLHLSQRLHPRTAIGISGGLVIGGWSYATAWSVAAGASGTLPWIGALLMLVALAAVSTSVFLVSQS